MEALRRLRRNSSETNVDRRLVTNVLLSFLTTPRADAKRFEMLSLLATILSWTDPEREKAGLQRAHSSIAPPPSFWSRSSAGSSPANGQELDKTDKTEVSPDLSPLDDIDTNFSLSLACGSSFFLQKLPLVRLHPQPGLPLPAVTPHCLALPPLRSILLVRDASHLTLHHLPW